MRKIFAANWKMNKTRPMAAEFAGQLAMALKEGTPEGRLALVFPPFTDIAAVADAFAGINNLAVGGQNFYPAEKGAFTGEISCAMLRDAGANWLLAGHSERRHVFGETDGLIAQKTAFGLEQGFKVMLCVGETLEERNNNQLIGVLQRQLSSAIQPLANGILSKSPDQIAVAYEPVWAIGTGKVAGPDEIREAHAAARKILSDLLGNSSANSVPLLYGGSVNAKNAGSIIALDNVDGLLVGGASLEAPSFLDILRA